MRSAHLPLIAAALAFAPAGAAFAQDAGLRTTLAAADTGEDTATPVRRAVKQPEDPYAPLGVPAGSFILYPSVTTGFGYTTNSSNAAGGTPSLFYTVTPELLIQSNWARHSGTLTLRGNYEQFLDGSTGNPSGSAEGTLHLDLPGEWSSDLAAGYQYQQQAISDPSFPAGADSPPGVHTLTGSAGLNGRAGDIGFTVEGNVARTIYENATSGGVPVDQGDRTNTVYGGRIRLGYESGAAITPFVEGRVARRQYDRKVDNNGLQRSGTELGARAGLSFDRGPVLTGEAAIGVAQDTLDDPTLGKLRGITFDGSVAWSPSQLTTVKLETGTEFRPATDASSSGTVAHAGSVDVAYAWRDNVTINGTATVEHAAVQGTGERAMTYTAGAAITWKLNRRLQLRASYVHAWLASTDSTRDYQSDAVKVELRAQH
jgi:hypothetical protein